MPLSRSRPLRGNFQNAPLQYGTSFSGAPLLWFPATEMQPSTGLIIAGTHGDESASIVALSCALRTLDESQRRHHVILCVNPDGCQSGIRANFRGVDLNRNFPAANWKPGETVYRWNTQAPVRDVKLSAGEFSGSEPETSALCQLITRIKPAWVVSFHEPLACIEDPYRSVLGQWLAKTLTLPLVTSVGYATPGSFGSWCKDNNLPCITAELPPVSADSACERYLEGIISLLEYSD
ncbi:murein tripeptide amidase MpaA [Mangrovibacter yixingensis]|uniref:murein tripeptide amidase MpaA n=1 Tax=Mangrovibacter yixingensis TaxID=1529639 RepID=UPI001CFC128B|nr:murein tripeptide amidase MpaA [Mangrovibacter yixingensis]